MISFPQVKIHQNVTQSTAYKNCTKNKSIPFKGTNYPIRDTDTKIFDMLQKKKVELLIHLREVSGMRRALEEKSQQAINFKFEENLTTEIQQGLKEAQEYEKLVREKLHEINLSLIKEEEKNY